MAHSDSLIFLTNITWIFLLFLVTYFFFVLFFLPSLFKKFRTRVLIKNLNSKKRFLAVWNALTSLIYFFDYIRGLGYIILNFVKKQFFVFSSSARFNSINLDETGLNIDVFNHLSTREFKSNNITWFESTSGNTHLYKIKIV